MEMTIEQFANAVAEKVNGKYEPVTKNNGVVLHGIVGQKVGNIAATVYVDDFYKAGLSVEQASEKVKEILVKTPMPTLDASFFKEFEKVKDMIKVRLLQNCNYGLLADGFGFEDLVLAPYVDLRAKGISGTIKLTPEHLALWGKTLEEVVEIGIKNIDDPIIKTMDEMLHIPTLGAAIYVITNKEATYGAVSIIKAKERLEHIFPEGYSVIPSSIHEVIVMSANTVDGLAEIIQEVNASTLDAVDILSNHPYIFDGSTFTV